jgi:cystathionine gamma-synthase
MKCYYKEPKGTIRIAQFEIAPNDVKMELNRVPVHIVLFPQDAFPIAKQFWQHSGDIISSRLAEYCLRIMDENNKLNELNQSSKKELYKPKGTMGSRSRSHYGGSRAAKIAEKPVEEESVDQTTYLEERYGRNLPVKFANDAKIALRRRIAGVLTSENQTIKDLETSSKDLEEQRQLKGDRGIKGISEQDVYLYVCGMSAIYHAHQIAMLLGDDSLHSVCFG